MMPHTRRAAVLEAVEAAPATTRKRSRPAAGAGELEGMAAEVRRSLGGSPPALPSKYFYDQRGMRLFERITELPEYYLTRTEQHILEQDAAAIVRHVRPREVVE